MRNCFVHATCVQVKYSYAHRHGRTSDRTNERINECILSYPAYCSFAPREASDSSMAMHLQPRRRQLATRITSIRPEQADEGFAIMRKPDLAAKGKPTGRVRAERISLRDERSHSEGISLASERSVLAPLLGKISLTLTKICFGEAAEKKTKRKTPRVGYSSYLIESSECGAKERYETLGNNRFKERFVDKVNGSSTFLY